MSQSRLQKLFQDVKEIKRQHNVGTQDALVLCREYSLADRMLRRSRFRTILSKNLLSRSHFIQIMDRFVYLLGDILQIFITETTGVPCRCYFRCGFDKSYVDPEMKDDFVLYQNAYFDVFYMHPSAIAMALLLGSFRHAESDASEDEGQGLLTQDSRTAIFSEASLHESIVILILLSIPWIEDYEGKRINFLNIVDRADNWHGFADFCNRVRDGRLMRQLMITDVVRRSLPDFSKFTDEQIRKYIRNNPFAFQNVMSRRDITDASDWFLTTTQNPNEMTRSEVRAFGPRTLYERASAENMLNRLERQREIAYALVADESHNGESIAEIIDRIERSCIEKINDKEFTDDHSMWQYFRLVLRRERRWLIKVFSN